MPYKRDADLPERVKKNLPKHARHIYRKAYNNAWKQYKAPAKRRGGAAETREEVSHKVAWAAVKQDYRKQGAEWVPKREAGEAA